MLLHLTQVLARSGLYVRSISCKYGFREPVRTTPPSALMKPENSPWPYTLNLANKHAQDPKHQANNLVLAMATVMIVILVAAITLLICLQFYYGYSYLFYE